MTASLKVTKPESMDPDCLIEWSKNAAAAAHERCSEAETYFNAMKRHYGNVTQLLERVQELRVESQPDHEEPQEIVDTLMQVMEAMDALTHEQFAEGAVDLEEEEHAILKTPAGQEADRQLQVEAQAFREAYFHHKARLGLKTQEDVERLTGINRRYISAIEAGKHKPQFRTIKKLADAFGIDVTKLMG
jgi:DNA-binding XRE family transcriptional regulator